MITVSQSDLQNFNFLQKVKFLRDKLFFNDFDGVLSAKPVDAKTDDVSL